MSTTSSSMHAFATSPVPIGTLMHTQTTPHRGMFVVLLPLPLLHTQDKYFVHPAMTVLHEPRSALRELLSIREFDPKEVIYLVKVGRMMLRVLAAGTAWEQRHLPGKRPA